MAVFPTPGISWIWAGKTYNPGDVVPEGFPVEKFQIDIAKVAAAVQKNYEALPKPRRKKGAK